MRTSPVGWSSGRPRERRDTDNNRKAHIAAGRLWPSFSTNGAAIQDDRDGIIDEEAWIDLVMKRNDIGDSYVFGLLQLAIWSSPKGSSRS